MRDRIPTKVLANGAIRYAVYDEQGNFLRYEYMLPADDPTDEGTPLNKSTLLSDTTAAALGLTGELDTSGPTVDDALNALSSCVESPYGLLVIRCKDTNGNPVQTSVTVSPAVNGETTLVMSAEGVFAAKVLPKEYTVSIATDGFYDCDIPKKTIEVVPTRLSTAVFEVYGKPSGMITIKKSMSLQVPPDFPALDIFAVGAGAGGGCVATISSGLASGGAGGYTATLLGQDLSGRTLTFEIGAKGKGGTVKSNVFEGNGTSGGTTRVKADEKTILTAGGGSAGKGLSSSNTGSILKGGNGGSGGAGAKWNTSPQLGGSDGSNGVGETGGTGQGTTTRAFGESDGELFSGGGGAAIVSYSSQYGQGVSKGNGGPGGGGSYGGNATKYGGGGCGNAFDGEYVGTTQYAGDGYDGVVMIRWGVAA